VRVAGVTVGVTAQDGEQPQGHRRRVGVDVNLEGRQYRVALERVAQRREVAAATVDATGVTVIGAFEHPAAHLTPHYAGYELAARYVDVADDAVLLEFFDDRAIVPASIFGCLHASSGRFSSSSSVRPSPRPRGRSSGSTRACTCDPRPTPPPPTR
jgi:hypothetical protein